jgi:hypothetical protein
MKKIIAFSSILSALIALFSFSLTSKNECVRERKITWYDSTNTKMKSEYWLCNGLLDSTYKEFDLKGRVLKEGNYSLGQKNGLWVEIFYQTKSREGNKEYSIYINGFLSESRNYVIDNNYLYLSDMKSLYIKSGDTIQVKKRFDIKSGFMTSLDTFINNFGCRTSYSWSPTTGHLKQINGKINTPDQYEKLFLKNGGYELIQYHKNMAVREKQLYNCEGVMVSKQLFDTLGKPLKARK